MSQQLSGKPLDVSVKVTNQLPQKSLDYTCCLSGFGELLPDRPHLPSLPHHGQVRHCCQSPKAIGICCFVGRSKTPETDNHKYICEKICSWNKLFETVKSHKGCESQLLWNNAIWYEGGKHSLILPLPVSLNSLSHILPLVWILPLVIFWSWQQGGWLWLSSWWKLVFMGAQISIIWHYFGAWYLYLWRL